MMVCYSRGLEKLHELLRSRLWVKVILFEQKLIEQCAFSPKLLPFYLEMELCFVFVSVLLFIERNQLI